MLYPAELRGPELSYPSSGGMTQVSAAGATRGVTPPRAPCTGWRAAGGEVEVGSSLPNNPVASRSWTRRHPKASTSRARRSRVGRPYTLSGSTT